MRSESLDQSTGCSPRNHATGLQETSRWFFNHQNQWHACNQNISPPPCLRSASFFYSLFLIRIGRVVGFLRHQPKPDEFEASLRIVTSETGKAFSDRKFMQSTLHCWVLLINFGRSLDLWSTTMNLQEYNGFGPIGNAVCRDENNSQWQFGYYFRIVSLMDWCLLLNSGSGETANIVPTERNCRGFDSCQTWSPICLATSKQP